MSSYLSYAEQAGHYFDRPHTEPHLAPIRGPAAWRGRELARQTGWRVRLDDAQVDEIERAMSALRSVGRPTGELTAKDFPLPGLEAEIRLWRDELATGRGFLVVSGVPVERWSQAEAERFFWCLGLHVG